MPRMQRACRAPHLGTGPEAAPAPGADSVAEQASPCQVSPCFCQRTEKDHDVSAFDGELRTVLKVASEGRVLLLDEDEGAGDDDSLTLARQRLDR